MSASSATVAEAPARATPGATEAADAVRVATLAEIDAALPHARCVAALRRAIVTEADLVGLMRHTAAAILALADLQDAAKAAEAELRDVLAVVMDGTGCSAVRIAAHTVTLGESPRAVIITDAKKIPADLWNQPAPTPDKRRIGALLKEKKDVPGCTLSNGGAPVLRFTADKKVAAS